MTDCLLASTGNNEYSLVKNSSLIKGDIYEIKKGELCICEFSLDRRNDVDEVKLWFGKYEPSREDLNGIFQLLTYVEEPRRELPYIFEINTRDMHLSFGKSFINNYLLKYI